MIAQTQAAAVLLNDRYREEWYGVHGALRAIAELVRQDFPHPDAATMKTRYEVDALRALKWQLLALTEGYERRT